MKSFTRLGTGKHSPGSRDGIGALIRPRQIGRQRPERQFLVGIGPDSPAVEDREAHLRRPPAGLGAIDWRCWRRRGGRQRNTIAIAAAVRSHLRRFPNALRYDFSRPRAALAAIADGGDAVAGRTLRYVAIRCYI